LIFKLPLFYPTCRARRSQERYAALQRNFMYRQTEKARTYLTTTKGGSFSV